LPVLTWRNLGSEGSVNESPQKTALYDLHLELGARMVPFAGYLMPVQYPSGILAEHRHTRASAGLFDVSHMGQIVLPGPVPEAAAALERLVPGDIAGLGSGCQRYTLLTNEAGGVRDDLMVTNAGDHLYLVVNAACKEADEAHLRAHLDSLGGALEVLEDRGLLALQGPSAAEVLARHGTVGDMVFMTAATMEIAGLSCRVSRSGYSGEDGFEISVANQDLENLARILLAEPEVEAIGLGARDTLRLEAGLCLYGHELDAETTPIEAGLAWTIAKRRRQDGGFPGADVILDQLARGPARRRIGLRPEGRVLAREGTEVMAEETVVGRVTSGGFGASVEGPVAMASVDAGRDEVGGELGLMVRGKSQPARVVALPFVPHRYAKA
jgi:aminomethyltransferase